MVKVFELSGYRFFFYSNEGKEPPHIHVEKQGAEAKVWLEGFELAWSYGFADHELGRIRDMVVAHRQLLGQAWRDRFGN